MMHNTWPSRTTAEARLARSTVPRWMMLVAVTALAAACGGGDAPPTPAQEQAAAVPAGGAPPAPAAEAPPPAAPAADTASMSIPDLLKAANQAVSEQRLVAPAGDNAIEYYIGVIKQDKENVQATQALVDIFPLAASIAERAVQQRDLVEAERIVGLLDLASPGSYTVTTLATKLDAMKQTVEREAAQQLAAEQRATEQRAAEERAEAEASAPPPAPAPEPARPRPQPAAPTQVAAATPPPAAAAPPPPPAPAVPAVTNAEVVRQVPPQYPPDAYRRRQEGWVELEFTIGADGKVRDVRVARAQPSRVFDREAIRAMQQWTFKPASRDGQAVETPGRRRIEFKL